MEPTKEHCHCKLVQKNSEMPVWKPSWIWMKDEGFPSKTENTMFPSKEPALFYLTARVNMFLLQAHQLKLIAEAKAEMEALCSAGQCFLQVTNCVFPVPCTKNFPPIFSGNEAPRGSPWHCAFYPFVLLLFVFAAGASLRAILTVWRQSKSTPLSLLAGFYEHCSVLLFVLEKTLFLYSPLNFSGSGFQALLWISPCDSRKPFDVGVIFVLKILLFVSFSYKKNLDWLR